MAERAAAELYADGQSQNTARSYTAALRYWAAWFRLRYGDDLRLPVAPATVLQFLVDHLERPHAESGELVTELPAPVDAALVAAGFKGRPGPLAIATVTHRLAVLSKAHVLKTYLVRFRGR